MTGNASAQTMEELEEAGRRRRAEVGSVQSFHVYVWKCPKMEQLEAGVRAPDRWIIIIPTARVCPGSCVPLPA
jgi:hypothetical protein